ncbi:MAG: hypothetical protein PVG25_05925 [Anaerolineae bacterium]|jgi:hypothetical protein
MRKRMTTVLAAMLLCGLLLAGIALASMAESYRTPCWTVDGGGGTFSTGGGYTLGGAIGQPDAGVLEGGVYVLAGGFWPGVEAMIGEEHIYLPLVMK